MAPVRPAPATAVGLIVATADGETLVVTPAGAKPFIGGYAGFVQAEVQPTRGDPVDSGHPTDTQLRRCVLEALHTQTGLALSGPALQSAGAPATHPDALGRLQPVGAWLTPEHCATRHRTDWFLLKVDGAAAPRAGDAIELAEFTRPADVLERWRDLGALLAPVTRYGLECLDLGADEAAHRLRSAPEAQGACPTCVEVVPGIRQLPLRTPTLPPAEHTNAYLIGHERLIIVDPAPNDHAERESLLDAVESLVNRGAQVDSIVLTHHHVDHVGAAKWLAERVNAPVAAHARTRSLLDGQIDIQRTLDEGDRIDLGRDDRGRPFEVEVLYTPGHASGHVVLVDQRAGARTMIVGDMVAATGSIVIDPPDGNMARYLDELRRLAALDPNLAFAAHGPPIVRAKDKLEAYIAHRLGREAKVKAALERAGPSRPADLLSDAYDDTPVFLYPLAVRACLAHLEKLVADGVAHKSGAHFHPAGD